MHATGDGYEASITDDGKAFNPLKKEHPDLDIALEDRPIGGLGIYFVHRLVDEIDYQRLDNKNCLKIAKRVLGAK